MIPGFTQNKVKLDADITINLVQGGSGEPLLLLHGYPETHLMWHKLAPQLANNFTVIAADLRGYGDSSKPVSKADHSTYSKRETANDLIQVMAKLGYQNFYMAAHDRGARVAHRMVLDHASHIKKLVLLDIIPTYKLMNSVNKEIALRNEHWFFMAQESDIPEKLISADPAYYLKHKLKRWSRKQDAFPETIVNEYIRCFKNPTTIHATCEDYRASVTIDLEHDRADLEKKITCPLLVLWSKGGLMDQQFDVLATWRERALHVQGHTIDCGHFLPEEAPEETYDAIYKFLISKN